MPSDPMRFYANRKFLRRLEAPQPTESRGWFMFPVRWPNKDAGIYEIATFRACSAYFEVLYIILTTVMVIM
jgi:hypothetical protein